MSPFASGRDAVRPRRPIRPAKSTPPWGVHSKYKSSIVDMNNTTMTAIFILSIVLFIIGYLKSDLSTFLRNCRAPDFCVVNILLFSGSACFSFTAA